MRKVILASFVLAAIATAPAAAQGGLSFGLNGGASVPIGDAADIVKTGFGGGATIMMRDPAGKLGFGIDAQWYRHSYDDALNTLLGGDLKQNLYGVLARLEYAPSRSLYLLGGAGLVRGEVTGTDDLPDFGDTSNTDFAIEGGLGLTFGPGLYLEGKILSVFSDQSQRFIPITIGIRF
jgi:hypothetical protein